MALFQWKWLRRFIRKRTSPIPHDTAHTWKKKLSIFYALLAWNAFGLVVYQMYKGKADWAAYYNLPQQEGTKAQQFARILNIPKAKVFKIKGFNVEEYDIDLDAEAKTATDEPI